MKGVINIKPNTQNLPTFPNYDYGAFVADVSSLGMTKSVDGWGIDQIADNMSGLIDYIENVLISGTGKGNLAVGLTNPLEPNQPLGNAYFYPSGLTCMHDGSAVQAYMYMNNVPQGNIPLISSLAGRDIRGLRGLLPGIFEDLNGFDPTEIVTALEINEKDPCVYPELPVTNINEDGKSYDKTNGLPYTYFENNPDNENKYNRPMFKGYAELIDPCLFKNGTNTYSNRTCRSRENFTNINPLQSDSQLSSNNQIKPTFEMSDDILIQIYFIAVAILFLFILLKMLHK